MYYYDPTMMNGNDWVWAVFMTVFWLVTLVMIGYVAMRILRNHESIHRQPDPLDIVKERYAKGEIDKEQFEQLKKDLK